MPSVRIVGGGLAGCEAAWQAASRGMPVTLSEMRPVRPTEVHTSDRLAELVCSNSLRADKLDNAVGLLKEEMRRLGSLVLRAADATRVPAGAALAVDREAFSVFITREISAHPLITVAREEVLEIPESRGPEHPVIIATGPLTSEALAGGDCRGGGAGLPLLLRRHQPDRPGGVDRSRAKCSAPRAGAAAWARSRREPAGPACGADDGEGDYLNCPMTADEYRRSTTALTGAEKATVHDFDRERFFEGCLPIEVLAHRGDDTLRFGPMKPVGLVDPRTGPEAVRGRAAAAGQPGRRPLQPRRVPDPAEVGRAGARAADDPRPRARGVRAVRDGAPQYLHQRARRCSARHGRRGRRPDLFFAGQISGVEGYVESAASGLLAGINAAALAAGGDAAARRRARQPSARWRTMCRTRSPAAISRATSPSGSWNRWPTPPRNKLARKTAIADARARRAGRLDQGRLRRGCVTDVGAGLSRRLRMCSRCRTS